MSLYDGSDPEHLVPDSDADQQRPRRNYVYAHLDSKGQIFYIGMGRGRRAWSGNRHPVWYRYVEKHLNGKYQVQILHENLSEGEAAELEAAWIAQHSDTLVNWINMGRPVDYEANAKYHKLRDANRSLIQKARAVEKQNLEQAVSMYIQAIESIQEYAFISSEKGLVGQLIDEETAEIGVRGEVEAIDRLTICLIKLGRHMEAGQRAASYFALYPGDLVYRTADRVMQRVHKVLVRKHDQVFSKGKTR